MAEIYISVTGMARYLSIPPMAFSRLIADGYIEGPTHRPKGGKKPKYVLADTERLKANLQDLGIKSVKNRRDYINQVICRSIQIIGQNTAKGDKKETAE